MVKLYIQDKADTSPFPRYILLDLKEGEAINLKMVLKDTNDISKIYNPYTQSFKIPATEKNKLALGFIGDTKIYRTSGSNIYDCKIYIGGIPFQSGKLTVSAISLTHLETTEYSCDFASGMVALKDIVGEDTIQNLTTAIVPYTDANLVYDLMNLQGFTSGNSITAGSYFVPLISNNRVWCYDPEPASGKLNNIYYDTRNVNPAAGINIREVRPAISFAAILNAIKLKYKLNVISPIESRSEFQGLFVWCNNETMNIQTASTVDLINSLAATEQYDSQNDDGGDGLTSFPRYIVSSNPATDLITLTLDTANSFYPDRWDGGFWVNIKLHNVIRIDAIGDCDFKFDVYNPSTGAIYNSGEATSVNKYLECDIFIKDDPSYLPSYAPSISFKIRATPQQSFTYDSMDIAVRQQYYHHYTYFGFGSVERAKYKNESLSNANMTSVGGGSIDLFKSLPPMKIIDFLTSYFKMFNISALPTGRKDLDLEMVSSDSLYWLTPSDIVSAPVGTDQSFVKQTYDYTDYVNIDSIERSIPTPYNCFNFQHVESKYYSNVKVFEASNAFDALRTQYGQNKYPVVKPLHPNEFTVQTQFSIIKPELLNGSGTVYTAYGFTVDPPDANGIYKPNFGELTLFYNNGFVDLSDKPLSVYARSLANELDGYIRTSPVDLQGQGHTLSFSPINDFTYLYNNSLYLLYYDAQIQRLLSTSSMANAVTMTLPARAIPLTGTSSTDQPTSGFRLQNDIIIGETKYSILDASIDMTTGASKMNLLNY